MRARMALDVAGVSVEHREILLRDKPQAMLDASPKGTVPVLVSDADVLDESLDIMVWALRQNDPEAWMINADQDRADVETFLSGFKDLLDRYKYASRYDQSVASGAVDLDQRRAAMTALNQFTASLDTTPFLRGDEPRLIDVATFPFIRQFAAVEPVWWKEAAPSGLAGWLETWLQSDRFKRIMKKHVVWNKT